MTIQERNKMFEEHRRIIFYVVHQHRSLREAMQMEFDDMAQELSICLLKAVESYDPTRGAKPSTYFFKRLRYDILDMWRSHVRDVRRANAFTVPLTYLDDDGEEIHHELMDNTSDFDMELMVREFMGTLSRREREAVTRNVTGLEPKDRRHKRYIDIIRRKARRFQLAGGGLSA